MNALASFLSSRYRFILIAAMAICSGLALNAQDATSPASSAYLNAGVGVSVWGLPMYANVEFPFKAVEHMTISVGGSYQTKKTRFAGLLGTNAAWRHTIIGFQLTGHYYLDAIAEIPEELDISGGLQLDYYIWDTKFTGDSNGIIDTSYSGSGTGGLGATLLAIGRYHFNERVSAQLILGGGTRFSSAKVGLSFKI